MNEEKDLFLALENDANLKIELEKVVNDSNASKDEDYINIISDFAKNNGYTVSSDNIKTLKNYLFSKDLKSELELEDLNEVSGGGRVCDWISKMIVKAIVKNVARKFVVCDPKYNNWREMHAAKKEAYRKIDNFFDS